MGRGGGGGGSSSDGGGGVNQEALPGSVNQQQVGSGLSDDGNLFTFNSSTIDEINTGNAPTDAAMVAAFRRGEINTSAALIVQTGPDSYRPADPTSARIIASARSAGANVNTVQVPNTRGQRELARRTQTRSPSFARVNEGRGLSDVGSILNVPSSEVRGGRTTASQSRIDRAARNVRRTGGNNFATVPVRQTGPDSYQVVGGRDSGFALAVVRRAGVDPLIFVVSD